MIIEVGRFEGLCEVAAQEAPSPWYDGWLSSSLITVLACHLDTSSLHADDGIVR